MAKKTSKKAVKLEVLVAVAEDFNSFMFEEGEGIDVELDYDELLAEVTESAGDLTKDDVVSEETDDALKTLKIKHPASVSEEEVEDPEEEEVEEEEEEEKPKKKAGKKAKAKVEVEEEEEEEVEEEEEEEVAPEFEEPRNVKKEIKAAKDGKLADLLDIAKTNSIRVPPPFLKDVKKLRPYVLGKLDDIAKGNVVKKAPGKKAAKKGPKMESGYCREFTYFEVISAAKKGMDFDAVIEAANALYSEKGGKENIKQAAHAGKTILKVLVAAGAVTLKGDKYSAA